MMNFAMNNQRYPFDSLQISIRHPNSKEQSRNEVSSKTMTDVNQSIESFISRNYSNLRKSSDAKAQLQEKKQALTRNGGGSFSRAIRKTKVVMDDQTDPEIDQVHYRIGADFVSAFKPAKKLPNGFGTAQRNLASLRTNERQRLGSPGLNPGTISTKSIPTSQCSVFIPRVASLLQISSPNSSSKMVPLGL